MRKPFQLRRAALRLGAAVLAGSALIAAMYYLLEPGKRGLAAMKSDRLVRVTDNGRWISMQPAGKAKEPSVIFYPGAFADPRCYAEFGRRVAAAGYRVYLVDMPLRLSLLGLDRALGVMAAQPRESFVIGGHSLGGSAAVRFASAHPEKVKGVFLIASFADKTGDLRAKKLPVLHIAATNDGIVHANLWRNHIGRLPADTEYVYVKGGNHIQFGSYRWFPPDAPASLTEAEQQAAVSAAMQDWLRRLTGGGDAAGRRAAAE